MSLQKLASRICLVLCSVLPAFAQPDGPTLDLKFDGPKSVEISGGSVRMIGPFLKAPDGKMGLGVGKAHGGLVLPVGELLGEKGTIVFTFLDSGVALESAMKNRFLLTVRGTGREMIAFYESAGSKSLSFAFKLFTDKKSLQTRQPIQIGRWYQVACTWDGLTVRFFLDGILQGEMPQPYSPTFPESSNIYLGPFHDGSINPKPWGNNSLLIQDLQVFARALPPAEIMAMAGAAAPKIEAQTPTFLAVPQVVSSPSIDGKLNDDAWQHASSLITLIDGQKSEESLSYKNNNPKFCHDAKNLYVGFESEFPESYKLLKGQPRAEGASEVWPDESFELLLEVDGTLFRFAGNAAGGYIDGLLPGGVFQGSWQYQSDLAMEIDNSRTWQGEISIPFESLGIPSPVGREIKVNFCRTWRGMDRIGTTSLTGESNYAAKEKFAVLKISDSDTAFQQISLENPNFGMLAQKAQISSSQAQEWKYTIKLRSSEGIAPEQVLLDKVITLKPGVLVPITSNLSIQSTSYDRLVFEVINAKTSEPLMQQAVPFQVSKDYLDVIPVFGKGTVVVKPRYDLAKNETGGKALELEVFSPDGKAIFSQTIASGDAVTVPFAQDNPVGTYHAELFSMTDGTRNILTSDSFHYPGVGAWKKEVTEDRVLPPFTPLTVTQNKESLEIGMWGRIYRYANSLLPETITALGQPVSTSAALSIDGLPVNAPLVVSKSTPSRVELTGSASSASYDLEQNSWIEYDGVLWNTVTLKAKKDLADVVLKIKIPDAVAKFYHAAGGGFGAGGARISALEGDVQLPFYPVIWVGDQERGISWFAESHASWKSSGSPPIRIIKEKDGTFLKILFADSLPGGKDLRVEFGLLATPVKPLPPRYPFTMFGDMYGLPWNWKAPHAPTTAVGLIQGPRGEELGNGFYDLPLGEEKPNYKMAEFIESVKKGDENNGIGIPYQAALFLPEEYPQVKDNAKEWQVMPEANLTYRYSKNDPKEFVWYNCCVASDAANFYLYKFKEFVKKTKIKGVYFDFGLATPCSNPYHGCTGGYPLLAKREFYKRVAGILADANNGEYTIVVHNSESVQIPVFTFTTHLFNGEALRQLTSNVFHNGKDILDHYTITDFATEQSSLPWGITSSIYTPTDPLLPEFGGDKEGGPGPQELYRFRMTKAVMAGALIHNTMPSQSRGHYGWYDKVIRLYDAFGVDKAEFLPYWRNKEYVQVVQGKDIYVSLYRQPDKKEVLAIISHVSKEHLDQDVTVAFNLKELGFKKIVSATELLTAPDPDYHRLYALTNRLREPIELGDFGVDFKGLEENKITLNLKHHSVAIVKIQGE